MGVQREKKGYSTLCSFYPPFLITISISSANSQLSFYKSFYFALKSCPFSLPVFLLSVDESYGSSLFSLLNWWSGRLLSHVSVSPTKFSFQYKISESWNISSNNKMIYMFGNKSFLKVIVKVLLLSRVRLFATPWTVSWQAPLFIGFSRQEYWSGLPALLQKIILIQRFLLYCRQTLYHLNH